MLQDTDGGPGMGGHSSVYTCAFITHETRTWSNYLKRGDGWDTAVHNGVVRGTKFDREAAESTLTTH